MRIELFRDLRPLSALCDALGATPRGLAVNELRGIATDSREVERGDVFVALRGVHSDGATYAEQALSRGAAAVLAPFDAPLPCGCPALRTDDVRVALLRAAAQHRRRQRGAVIAVSGSTGKTTAKEAIATVLTQRGTVAHSHGNFNSDVGMPLSLLSFDPCDYWVVEIGVSHPGEMAPLARTVSPTLAVLTNVGTAHIGNYGSAEALLREKLTLIRHVSPAGRALLPYALPCAKACCDPTAVYRFGHGGDFYLTDISEGEKGIQGDLITPDRVITNLGWPYGGQIGASVIETVGGACALLGATDSELRCGLRAAGKAAFRMRQTVVGDRLFIDDSYNASPEATEGALRALGLKANGGPAVAVLGDMLELGAQSEALHERVGRAAAEQDLAWLVTYGDASLAVARAARGAGMPREHILSFARAERSALVEALCRVLPAGATVLWKASGKMKLSEIVEEVAKRV